MVAPIEAVDTIVTDRSAPADIVEEIRRQGVDVIFAN